MSNLLDKASIILTPTAYNNGEALCVKPSDGSGDFDFSRNSAATRVNAQGLVENVQILSSNLVQNGDFSQEGVQEVSNGSFSQEGVELVTNGSFDTDSDWTLGTGWSIANGNANSDGVSSNSSLYQNVGGVNNTIYKITGTISNYVSGTLQVGGSSNFLAVNSNGDFVHYRQWTSDSTLYLKSVNFIGSIDNVSVREVGQDWTLGTGWSIAEDKAVATVGSGGLIQSGLSIVSGKTYNVTFDVNINSGTLLYDLGDAPSKSVTQSGSVSVYFVSQSTTAIRFFGSTFDGSITNISAKEVGQNWSINNVGAATTNITLGALNIITAGDFTNAEQSGFLTSGNNYSLTYTIISNSVVGVLQATLGTAAVSVTVPSTVGTHTVDFTAAGSSAFAFKRGGGALNVSITNISVIEITDDTNLPRINYEGFSYQDALGSEQIVNGDFSNGSANWNFASSWSISGGKAICSANGGFGSFSQNNSLTIGKKYKITLDFDGSGITSGVIRMNGGSFSNPASERTLVDGENILYLDAISTSFGINESGAFGIATIDNVSVKEYLGQEVVPDSGCGHWLWEPQSTNLIPYSEDFSQWTTSNSTEIANNAISPSGGMNAYKLYPNSSGDYRNLTTGGQILGLNTFSIFAKAGELQHLVLIDYDGAGAGIDFNLSTGVATDVSTSGFDSFDMVDYGNGWYRCIATATDGYSYWILSDNGDVSVTANGTDGLYIWGAQVEQQSYATSYIPTSGSTVTRNQDVCTNGGSLASINSTSGTLYAEIAALVEVDNARRFITLNDGTSSNAVVLRYEETGVIHARYQIGGVAQCSMSFATTITDTHKVAFKYAENDFSLWIDGVEVGVDGVGNVLATNTINNIDFDSGNGNFPFYGKTKAVAVWKEALSDEELTELTTI